MKGAREESRGLAGIIFAGVRPNKRRCQAEQAALSRIAESLVTALLRAGVARSLRGVIAPRRCAGSGARVN